MNSHSRVAEQLTRARTSSASPICYFVPKVEGSASSLKKSVPHGQNTVEKLLSKELPAAPPHLRRAYWCGMILRCNPRGRGGVAEGTRKMSSSVSRTIIQAAESAAAGRTSGNPKLLPQKHTERPCQGKPGKATDLARCLFPSHSAE